MSAVLRSMAIVTMLLSVAVGAQEFDIGHAAFERHLGRAVQGVPAQFQERIRQLCMGPEDPYTRAPGVRLPGEPEDPAQDRYEPARVFDNLYFIGDRNISVWALATSAGLILFDATHADLVEDRVIGGLRKLGLDPATIRYVVVTHGHDDHYGGAVLLQQRFGARVVMGVADWSARPDPDIKGFREPLPRRDIYAGDMALTLGDTTVTIVATPGHTPGTLSMLFPVTDRGAKHVASLWGGGFPHESVDAMRTFALSAERYAAMAAAAGADVIISNHPRNDDSLAKMAALAKRGSSDANPFVVGATGAAQRAVVLSECARAYVAMGGRPRPASGRPQP